MTASTISLSYLVVLLLYGSSSIHAFTPPELSPSMAGTPSSADRFRRIGLQRKRVASPQQQSSMVSKTQQQQQEQPTTTTLPSSTSTTSITTTPLPKYPTARGDTVDARQIVATGAGQQYLTAVRLQHILLRTEEMALESFHRLRALEIGFAELAQQLSACPATRERGGAIGWVSVQEYDHVENDADDNDDKNAKHESSSKNAHLDDIFPKVAREKLIQITTKPGDIVMVASEKGFHLVQVIDVMADVQKMATKRLPFNKRANPVLSQGLWTSRNNKNSKDDDQSTLTYKMETMGCQMNMADSERIEGQIQNLGIRPWIDTDGVDKKPDIVILNTCSIRDHAEQKVYSYIGPHAKRKRDGEHVTIVVAGCVAQQEGEALLRRAPEVDLVMGPQYANRIGDLLEDVANGNQVVATEASHIMEDSTKPRRQSTVAAWVNVIYGCNERCTFCIVPTTRGVEQSRPVESIVAEVEELIQDGYKEVTLLGQNIDAYGRDMIPKRKFSDLIRTVGSLPGLERLRFVTSHPRYMSLGVVDAVAETPAACESFHIPFQSGSNRILAAMGRGHTREKYLHIVDRIRTRLPDAAITADVIVGFPGETEQDFQDTLALMEQVVFDSVNTAAYSPRPNTPAATMSNQIPEDVKKDRLHRINELNAQHAAARRARLLGQPVQVLMEERNVRVPTQVMGRTRHGYIVYSDGDIDKLRGQLVDVQIDSCQTYHLTGHIVSR